MQINVSNSLEASKEILNNFESKLLVGEPLEDSYLLLYSSPTENFITLNRDTAGNIIGTAKKDSVVVDNNNIAYVYFFKNNFEANTINIQFEVYKNIISKNINNFFVFFKDILPEKEAIPLMTYQEDIFCFINSISFKKKLLKKSPFNTQNLIGHSILLEGSSIGSSILGNESYKYLVGITYNMQYIMNISNLKILISCIVFILEKSLQKIFLEKKDFLNMYNLYMHKLIS